MNNGQDFITGLSIVKVFLISYFILAFSFSFLAQLIPGFDALEFKEMLLISAQTNSDLEQKHTHELPLSFHKKYSSDTVGFDNLWELWTGKQTAVISIRASTNKEISWLADFQSTMTLANGSISLSKTKTFDYNLSSNPKALVHTGWLLSLAYLADDIEQKIKEQSIKGVKDFIITGHSQGGAIAMLLRTHLNNLQQNGEIASNLTFKVYCSGTPKVGNLYFAYEYEKITQGGWGFNIINTKDWVPETPVSIQRLKDFNEINLFSSAKKSIKKQPYFKRILFNFLFKKLQKPTKKAERKYRNILGKRVSKRIHKTLPSLIIPINAHSFNYVRTGVSILLFPGEAYSKMFSESSDDVFIHHSFESYLFLIEQNILLK